MSYLIRRVLAKPRLILDEMCRLYGKFASYLRHVLCKTRLIFPRINGPNMTFHVPVVVATKKMHQKVWCSCRVVVLLIWRSFCRHHRAVELLDCLIACKLVELFLPLCRWNLSEPFHGLLRPVLVLNLVLVSFQLSEYVRPYRTDFLSPSHVLISQRFIISGWSCVISIFLKNRLAYVV